MKISEIIDRLEKWHAPLEQTGRPTADTVKIGDTGQECTGIATTCFVTVEVVRQAIAKGCNLIICHEPLFYGDAEYSPFLEKDPVYQEKKKLLADNGIVVYRDHDHIHGPGGIDAKVHPEIDYIYYGIMKELGWEQYVVGEKTKPLWYHIPKTTAKELAECLVQKLGLTGARVVGDLDTPVEKVFLCEHVFGNDRDYEIISEAAKADAIIPLEIVDWTLTEYVRDSCQLGMKKAVIEMGHFNTEEPGMRYMLTWLAEAVGEDIPLVFLQSGDHYRYVLSSGDD